MRFINPAQSMFAGVTPSSTVDNLVLSDQRAQMMRVPSAPMGYAGSNAPAWPPAGMTAQQMLIMESGAVTAAAAEHCTPGSGCPVSVKDITVFAWLKIPAYAAVGVPTAQPAGSGWAPWHAAWKRMHDQAAAAAASYGGGPGYAAPQPRQHQVAYRGKRRVVAQNPAFRSSRART